MELEIIWYVIIIKLGICDLENLELFCWGYIMGCRVVSN